MISPKKLHILFLCTGNSCRSQMAEGLCRHFSSDTIEAYSAGIEAQGLNPLAVKVMGEIGIDISGYQSKTFRDLSAEKLHYVVTVCDHASETCPIFPGDVRTIHKGFDDPPKLSKTAASEEEALGHYRRVRDEIKKYIMSLPYELTRAKNASDKKIE